MMEELVFFLYINIALFKIQIESLNEKLQNAKEQLREKEFITLQNEQEISQLKKETERTQQKMKEMEMKDEVKFHLAVYLLTLHCYVTKMSRWRFWVPDFYLFFLKFQCLSKSSWTLYYNLQILGNNFQLP